MSGLENSFLWIDNESNKKKSVVAVLSALNISFHWLSRNNQTIKIVFFFNAIGMQVTSSEPVSDCLHFAVLMCLLQLIKFSNPKVGGWKILTVCVWKNVCLSP